MAKKVTYKKRKSLALRIFICIIAALLFLGIILTPALVNAEESSENITVRSFETGRLADAIAEAADGTDYNFIKNVAVLSGTLNSQDYTALTAIPNLEILELAGTETEDGIIPENALTSRNQLTLITLPKNTSEIGKNALSGNRKLIKVTMPATVTKIDDYAFASCEALAEVPVSEAVTYIGEGAFRDCKAITEFVIPAGITELYPDTFSKCGFESISIGPNVAKIGSGVFADCNNLKDIYAYGENAPVLDSDVFRNVSASVHCYEDSGESYKSWEQNNIKISADLTGEYTLSAAVPVQNNEVYETQADTSSETSGETESSSQSTAKEESQSEQQTEQSSQSVQQTEQPQGGGLSVGVVIVIAVMAAVIGVLATILIMSGKKK